VRLRLNAFTVSLAAHLFALVWLLSPKASSLTPAAATGDAPAIRVEWLAELPQSRQAAPDPVAVEFDQLQLDPDARELVLSDTPFDLGPIAARAAQLFPFLTDTLALEPALSAMRDVRGGGLTSPLPSGASDGDHRALEMTDEAMQQLVDSVWTRRERWPRFQRIAAFTRAHDPDRGQLPTLLRRYADHTVLQPYVDSGTRDARLWTMLGLAAEHVDFIGFITRYAAEHPSSRAAIELMFLLDDLAQGSRDTLLVLLEIDPDKQLWRTATVNRDAHRLVSAIRRYYSRGLEGSGLPLRVAVHAHYDAVRLAILDAIRGATPGGYRDADARFLIGSIYWRQRRVDDALAMWRAMTVTATDRHAAVAAPLLQVVNPPADQTVDAEAVARILGTQRTRWADFWYARLRRFGYRADTY
jgi:hypothetical protein